MEKLLAVAFVTLWLLLAGELGLLVMRTGIGKFRGYMTER
jgi:hypothetical protein